MTDITLQVKNYTGSNSFVLKMKDAISKYGSLTVNQKSAVEKIFKNVEEVKKVEFTPEMKEILSYDGPSSFVNDLKSKLNLYGKLSEKQIQAGLNQIQKEKNQKATVHMNIPVEGDSVKVGRMVGQKLKDTYGLKFNPTILDITKVLAVSPKAVKFSGLVCPNLNGNRISAGLPLVRIALPGLTSKREPRGKRVASIAIIGAVVSAKLSRWLRN